MIHLKHFEELSNDTVLCVRSNADNFTVGKMYQIDKVDTFIKSGDDKFKVWDDNHENQISLKIKNNTPAYGEYFRFDGMITTVIFTKDKNMDEYNKRIQKLKALNKFDL